MKARIRRFDKDLPLPGYQTEGAAAQDTYVRETITIAPHEVGVLSLNIAIEPPPGHFVLMAARSSLWKRGLMLVNGVGILDEDYAGNNDEYRAALYNFTSEPITIERGERVTQIIMLPYDRIEWEEVEELERKDRGGYGTTGK